ncbi:hypothetical protein Gohar_018697 [Gossypium harknessii]|uniref:Uncharacterized protein n=1 Tax=Gossypium harknessii TaxID=34285 RepID=A0A7J9G9Y7_9ROSI|nr:hypothetical protein [Gossypium harknessii]
MYPSKKFMRFYLGISRHEEKGRCCCIEYIRVSNLPQSPRAHI